MNPTSFSRSSTAPTWIGDVGHRLVHPGDPLRRGDQREELEPGHAGRLEDLAGTDRRAAGGEHRVDDQGQRDPRPGRELVVILGRPEGRLVAEQADVPDLGLGDQLEDARRPSPARRGGSARSRRRRRGSASAPVPSGVVTSTSPASAGRPSPPGRAASPGCAPAGGTRPAWSRTSRRPRACAARSDVRTRTTGTSRSPSRVDPRLRRGPLTPSAARSAAEIMHCGVPALAGSCHGTRSRRRTRMTFLAFLWPTPHPSLP